MLVAPKAFITSVLVFLVLLPVATWTKVFLNVIVNAPEAMEAGGTLTLRTRRAEQGLKDSGIGLGVAIARSVVEQHGGRMDIRSQLGRDTQARVFLPLGAP